MLKLEDIQPNSVIRGIIHDGNVTAINIKWYGTEAIELTYKDPCGSVANQLIYRHDEVRLEIVEQGRPWSFDGEGDLFRLVSEAQRINLAYLFDPVLAVHTSVVEPLPHQITAVYEHMLPRQPLRFLLADDPGAGKTIMAGLLIRELMARGDLERCLIVCPGSLAEQWQDELYQRFNLPFDILTNDKLEAARTGNWFMESDLVIARLDKLSRNEEVRDKLKAPDCRWDLIVCDEAHKMSATYFGGEIKYTKRYHLGRDLSEITRHFLLMTATPHNGKEADFQLFMALLDGDRFEGKFRDGVHTTDVRDLMRRMVKEELLRFNGKPLFPPRVAKTVPYRLSDRESQLYAEVTEYVREEFNRAEKIENGKRAGTVGFALTVLQRRLASSPEAIYQSLKRRKERLESRLKEMEAIQRGRAIAEQEAFSGRTYDEEDLEDLEDTPEEELKEIEEEVLDKATAARSIVELKAEIETLKRLESLALEVLMSGEDAKWRHLTDLLEGIFTSAAIADRTADGEPGYGKPSGPKASPSQKLIIFTEHRDTLNYLRRRISTLLGREEAVVMIHGGMGREDRLKTQEAFKFQPEVQVLIATDAAGEGINLQRAHLMVNYDLPWNPNRLEQRFGRIHRIGQQEVCHLWNLVAEETREGDVYLKLLKKLDQARETLGGRVFDVLGKLQFEGKSLRDLLIEAIRFGERPDVKAHLDTVFENTLDKEHIQDLFEEKALVRDVMDSTDVMKIREDMERAEARRLQPNYIESFFIEAFNRLGGTVRKREPKRYQVTHVPAAVRNRDRMIGTRQAVLPRYERITFEKDLVAPQGQPMAAFVCPSSPLLNAVIDMTLERHRDLLRRGTVLVDDGDDGMNIRVFFYLEHKIQDASKARSGGNRVISKRVLYVEMDQGESMFHVHYAPYLDYRPLEEGEPVIEDFLSRPEGSWISRELEDRVQVYAVTSVVPEHLQEVSKSRLAILEKTEKEVKDRLSKEINYWDHRAEQLKAEEQAGKRNSRLNSNEARKRADVLQNRMQRRLQEIQLEKKISPLPPVVLGGFLVVPIGLIHKMNGDTQDSPGAAKDTQESAARARNIVMEVERRLGFEPTDREFEKLGYDIESRVPGTGKLRFIEVKGRVSGAPTITVTKNEILYSLNKPEDFILAIVEFTEADGHRVHYVRQPFRSEPDFGVTSVNYNFTELLARAEEPR